MSVSQKQVQILGTLIREDSNGYLCINDFFRAYGSKPKNRPSQWLKLNKTKEYIKHADTMSRDGIPSLIKKQELIDVTNHVKLTYANKHVFLNYADWLIASVARKNDDKGYVYLIRCESFIKIGKSKRVNQRIKDLQTANPFPLFLVHKIKSDEMSKLERKLHLEYQNSRTHGEWFNLSDSDIKDIINNN